MKLLLPVRRDAVEDDLVLAMRPNRIAIRTGAAARQSGLGEGCSGDNPSPWATVKPRYRAYPARSLVRRGSVSADGAALMTTRVPLGNALFELQAQLFLTKRAGTVRPPHGHRSDSLIVILYVGHIKYQSGEGRLSDEVVDQLGKEPVAEEELPSPATAIGLSRKS